MEFLNEVSDLLEVHAHRDKVSCLAGYIFKLCGATSGSDALLKASAKIAAARATIRILEEPSVLKGIINYGLGEKDGPFWGNLGVLHGLFQLAYIQAEKACFVVDAGLVSVSKEADAKLRIAHKLFWSLSSFCGFIRSLRALKASYDESQAPEPRKCAQARLLQASLVAFKGALDLVHTVSWLPAGWLWGGRLSTKQASAVATVYAALNLVTYYHGKRLASSAKPHNG